MTDLTTRKSNAEMIGRDDVDDLEAVLSVTTPDDGSLAASVQS